MSDEICMDFRKVMFFFHPHVACSLAFLFSFVLIMILVCSSIVTDAVMVIVTIFHPNMSSSLTLFLSGFVVLVSIGVVAHLISMLVSMLISVFITMVSMVTVATTAFFGNVFDIVTS